MTAPILIWCQQALPNGLVNPAYQFGCSIDEDHAAHTVRTWCEAWAGAGYDICQDARHGTGWFAVDASGPQIRVRATLWIEYPDEYLREWVPDWLSRKWVVPNEAPAGWDSRDVAAPRGRVGR